MATNLGKLVVSLGLDAAEFVFGINKAETQAKKFAQNVNSAMLQVGKVLGSLKIGQEFIEATKDIIDSAAALDDLSDATGSSVEALSQLSNQATIAGTDFATLQTLVLKMSVGMAGMDDESTKAAQALKALGVTSKDPAKALQEVAVALSKYQDGVEKAALANAIFGKGGAAFLATLKDIAELQGVQATVTKEQAKAAEDLEKAWRTLVVESRQFANVLLDVVVPGLLKTIEQLREGSRIAGGFWAAVSSGMFGGLHPFDTTAEAIARTKKELVDLNATLATTDPGVARYRGLQMEIDKATKKLEFLRFKAQQEFVPNPADTNVRDILNNRLPRAPTITDKDKDKAGKGGAARQTEAERYLATLQKQVEATQDLTTVQTLQRAIEEGLTGLTPGLQAKLFVMAEIVDAYKAQDKAIREAAEAEKEALRVAKEAEEQRKRNLQAQEQETAHIAAANRALSDEIAFIRGGEEALKAIERQRIQDTIATKEDLIAQLQLNTARAGEIPEIEKQITLLKERLGLLKDKDVAIALKADRDALQALSDVMSDSFADAFEGFVMGTKSASQAFKDMANDIERYLLKIALHKLGDQMFGGQTSGSGDVFGAAFKALLGLFGGGSTGGGLGQFSLNGAAAGTSFAYGGPTVVGENGPEIVDMPRGARVWPNGTAPQQTAGESIHMENHFHVQGTVNTQTIRQIERGVGDSVARNRLDR